ncbi:MAG: hypothetical protein M3M99_05805 [Actinomycetota bacterium]|nr:hypothetical protein [Actinomycetota bacterium]
MEETRMTESTPQTCAYPGCEVVMEPAPERGGPAPRYCADPEHNTHSVFHALKRGEGHTSPETAAGLGLKGKSDRG